MIETIEKKAPVATVQEKKRFVFYRVSRISEDDQCWYDEKLVRYALSAWLLNVDRAMARLYKGEKVFTPYAYYVAKPV